MTRAIQKNQLPSPSPGRGDGVDEIAHASPDVQKIYSEIQAYIERAGVEKLNRLNDQANQMMRELGVTFSAVEKPSERDHVLPIDLFPRIISAEEWNFIARGIQQRIRIWNAFFKDIYASQEILKAKVIPHEIVFNDPCYLRSVVGVSVPEDAYVHVAAFDLVRDRAGQWIVVEDQVGNTTGATYALRSRHVLNLVVPEILEFAEILSNDEYPSNLLEHLKAFAATPNPSPRVVLLSAGHPNRTYYEHSYLAREMGVPLVQERDLVVLNSQVYLKTIGGLEKIEVIYRRVEDDSIDPLSLQGGNQGIPGLMNCIRKGTVTLASAIGTGLGDNRAIGSYLSKMARFYLNESLILPTVDRYLCLDVDQCEEVLHHPQDFHVFKLSDRNPPDVFPQKEEKADAIKKLIRRNPADFVAESRLPLNLLPAHASGEYQLRPCGLRVFGFGGADSAVYPCALTRYTPRENSRDLSSAAGGGIKDTWILGKEPEEAEAPMIITAPAPRLRLASRIAESLFWTGRYLERAENTTRFLKVLNRLALEQKQAGTPAHREPLWEVLARATGHPAGFFTRKRRWGNARISHYILFDPANPSSVFRCIENCYHNVLEIRDSVSPEMIAVVIRLHRYLKANGGSWAGANAKLERLSSFLRLQENILNQLDALSGAIAKSMLRGDGWHFLLMGNLLERSLHTLYAIRHVFMRRAKEPSDRPRRDDRNLDALLQMLSCRYAYRSLFHARPAFRNVSMLLLQDGQLPRSVLFCVQGIFESLGAVFGEAARRTWNKEQIPPLKRCARLVSEVEFADLTPYFESEANKRPPLLRNWLDQLIELISELSSSISDHYLHHQNFTIIR